jgi:putative peptide zinc metalloprotease protein
MTDTLTSKPASGVPQLAPGVELIGEYQGHGFKETPYLARRADGQVIQLSHLLYLVAAQVDGQRSFEEIAARVTEEFGRDVSADNIDLLLEKKLRPLGVVADEDGSVPEKLERASPLLELKFRVGLVSERAVRAITAVFWPLFLPPVIVAVFGGLIAFDVWLFFHHGLLQSVEQILYQPSLIFAFFLLETLEGCFHEFGHASACRYGGAKPGKLGVGIYLIFFVYYSDVTDSYRLNKAGRLRTDLGGMYFDAVFSLATAGAYFLTGFEPLLILAFFSQLDALDEFTPFARFDGYYVISDWIGVPDLFSRIRPILLSAIPGRRVDERVTEMKPWARAVVTVWVLTTVPILMISLVLLVIYGPTLLAAAWRSVGMQWGAVSRAFEAGTFADIAAGLIQIGVLLSPVIGVALFVGLIVSRLASRLGGSRATAEAATAGGATAEGATAEGATAEGATAEAATAEAATADRETSARTGSGRGGSIGRQRGPLLRAGFAGLLLALVATAAGLMLYAWSPQGGYGPIQRVERATLQGSGIFAVPEIPADGSAQAPEEQASKAPPNDGKATTDGKATADGGVEAGEPSRAARPDTGREAGEPSRAARPDTGRKAGDNAAAASSVAPSAPSAPAPSSAPPSGEQGTSAQKAPAAPQGTPSKPAPSLAPPSPSGEQGAPTIPWGEPAHVEPATALAEPAVRAATPKNPASAARQTPVGPGAANAPLPPAR